MEIEYRVNAPLGPEALGPEALGPEALDPEALGALFARSGIRRPDADTGRLRRMIAGANLTVTAWDGPRLVGVARALTDHSWCCYLSDLAVDRDYQRRGIGRALVARVRAEAGDEATLLLVSAPEAMAYYPKLGLEPLAGGWVLRRAR